ncbi:YfhO family protein [Listeria costaricensis]|uniref:YfhO family protein n=1 Tax=Listeria costaricensis TaxID=2026604 RepID=UPI000C072F16|nr:YfhO family protein [Listeria costaricensis]
MKIKKRVVYLLAFLLPMLAMTSIFAFQQFHPFGDRSIFVVDLYGQYRSFFYYFYDFFHQTDFTLFSWETALGMNQAGVFSYYLSSPFNFLLLLFSRDHLPDAIVFLTIFKIGAAGATMAFYLKRLKTFSSDTVVVMFSLCYALMGYAMCYAQNVMWLDGLIYLPLILEGVEKIIRRRFSVLFVLALALMFISSFYISYMVGGFVFVYFIVKMLSRKIEWRKMLSSILIFLSSTLLSLGISFVLFFPTIIQSQTIHKNASDFIPNAQGILRIFAKFFNGTYDSLITTGGATYYANIFSGILVIILLPVFFLSKKTKWREKICFGVLVALFMLSFKFGILNLIWHAMTPPTWFPYRFSFLFSFTIIVMAFILFQRLDAKDRKWIFLSFIAWFALLVMEYVFQSGTVNLKLFIGNAMLLVAFTTVLLLLLTYPSKRKLLTFALAFLVFADMTSNGLLISRKLDKQFTYKDYSAVQLNQKADNIVKGIQKNDDSFYRMALNFDQYENNGYLYQANTISHNSSMLAEDLAKTMRQFGYSTQPENRKIISNGGTVLSDSILGVKYQIDPANYKQAKSDKVGNYYVYENPSALPLGFFIDPSAAQEISTALDKDPYVDMVNAQQNLAQLIGDSQNEIVSAVKPIRVVEKEGTETTQGKETPYYDTIYYLPQITSDKILYQYTWTNTYDRSSVLFNDQYAYTYPIKGHEDGVANISMLQSNVTKVTYRSYNKKVTYPIQ